MKNTLLILIALVSIGLTKSYAQYFTQLGGNDRDVESIVKILVLDSENSRPISGAVVRLLEKGLKVFEIQTDRNGVAVIVIRDWKYEEDRIRGVLKVRDKDYNYSSYEDKFNMVSNYSKYDINNLFLMSRDFHKLDVWGDRETAPTNYDIYKKITNEDYIAHQKGTACYYDDRNNGYDPPYGTPGFFEINIRLRYQHHSSDVQRYSNTNDNYNDSRNDNYNDSRNNSYNDSSLETGYNGLKFKESNNDIKKKEKEYQETMKQAYPKGNSPNGRSNVGVYYPIFEKGLDIPISWYIETNTETELVLAYSTIRPFHEIRVTLTKNLKTKLYSCNLNSSSKGVFLNKEEVMESEMEREFGNIIRHIDKIIESLK